MHTVNERHSVYVLQHLMECLLLASQYRRCWQYTDGQVLREIRDTVCILRKNLYGNKVG